MCILTKKTSKLALFIYTRFVALKIYRKNFVLTLFFFLQRRIPSLGILKMEKKKKKLPHICKERVLINS
jgi:hypothetical protein